MVVARPGMVRLRSAGESRAGRPLWVMSFGRGERQVLTVAGAHANEPVGGVSALALAEEFVRDPGVLEEWDCTWHFLLCLDPDGAALAVLDLGVAARLLLNAGTADLNRGTIMASTSSPSISRHKAMS